MSILEMLSVSDIATIAGYMLVMLSIAIYSTKRIKNAQDYTSAGKSLSWKMVAGSTISTCMGANMVIGKYDLIFESGLAGLTASLFWWVGWIFLLLMAKRLRASGVMSIPDFLEMRFGSRTRKICSYCVLIMVLSSCAAQFLSVGTILEAFGICSREIGTWIGAGIIVLFTVFGGLWGVAITDTIQSIIMLITFGIIFPLLVFKTAGGWNTVIEFNSPERLSMVQGIAPITMIGWAVYYSLCTGSDPSYAQRIFSAKTTKDAVVGHTVAWISTLLVAGFLSAVPGLAIKMIFPEITAGSHFTPLFIATYFPEVIRGLVLSALFGLMLTSGDSYLLLLASTFTDDIVRPRKPELSNKSVLFFTRAVCVISAGVICVMALYVDKIYQLFKTGGGAYGAGVFFPLIMGCFWKRARTKAVNLGIIAGCGVSFCFDMFLKIPLQWDIDGCIIGAALCLVICVGGSLIGKEK